MRILSLDIGTRRTGMAFCDDGNGVVLPLDTLAHDSVEAFAKGVSEHVENRRIEVIVIGLPLLPSGQEGAQAKSVREYAATLVFPHVSMVFLDERYTTPHHPSGDGDAMAASAILNVFLDRKDI